MKKTKHLLVSLLILFNLSGFAQDFVDFNTSTDLEMYFTPGIAPIFTSTATGGLNNSGAVQIPSSGTDVWTSIVTYPLEMGATYTVSAFFKVGGNSGYAGLGFATEYQNESGGNTAGIPNTSIGMGFHGGGGSFINNNNETTVSWEGGDLTLENWYFMIYTIKNTGQNTFDAIFEIYKANENGTILELKTSHSEFGITNSDLGSAMYIYPVFSNSGNRMAYMDNFGTISNVENSQILYPPGNALSFDGVEDYVDLGNTEIIGDNTSFTIETWIKPDLVSSGGIYGEFLSASNHTKNYLNLTANKHIAFDQYLDNGGGALVSNTALNENKWYHIAYVQDGTNRKIYINGVLDIEDNSAETYNGSVPDAVCIGARARDNTIDEIYTGEIDEFRLWNIARTETQIQANMYNIIQNPSIPSLIAYYIFDEIDGTTLIDQSDVPFHDGTLINMTGDELVESYAMVVPMPNEATNVTSTGFTANWNAPTIGIVESYLLDVSVVPDFSTFVNGYENLNVGNVLTYDVSGLTSEVTYYYRVRAEKTSVTGTGAYYKNNIEVTLPTSTPPMQLVFNTNLSAGTTITLPLQGTVDVTVDWGDGNNKICTTAGNQDHIYTIEGTYTVTITGSLSHFGSQDYTNANKLISVLSWGDLELTDLSFAFHNATNLIELPADIPATVTNMYYMFFITSTFNQNISSWDVSNVTNMEGMFQNASSFNQNIGSWNVANVTNMAGMFQNASSFNQNINSWNVISVTNMFRMFLGSSFNQDISNWNVTNVTSMNSMFTSSAFNQNIGSWDISSVTEMDYMFAGTILSTENYDALLVGWSQQTLQPDVSFDGGSSKYTAIAERAILTDIYNWTVTDGGLADADFGDLPTEYNNTLLVNNGALHFIVDENQIMLGTSIDSEPDGQESTLANAEGTDDDGILITSEWEEGIDGGAIEVTVTGGGGYLSGWIDWNSDNDFEDEGEQILYQRTVLENTQTITFDIPEIGIGNFSKFARFRLYDTDTYTPTTTGITENGEVEDYNFIFDILPNLQVVTSSPENNTINVETDEIISVEFNLSPDIETFNSSSFYVEGTISGEISGLFSVYSNTVTFTPNTPFIREEVITVILTTDITGQGKSLVENYTFNFTIKTIYDFGDLPIAYNNTLLEDNGAGHILVSSNQIMLGTSIDSEPDGQESTLANAEGTDDDGILITSEWEEGIDGGAIEVTVTGGGGYLSGWIDWNSDNDFEDEGEQILYQRTVLENTQTITFDIPEITMGTGNISRFARFRLYKSDTYSHTTTGITENGEVEDYNLEFNIASNFNVVNNSPANTATNVGTDAVIVVEFNLTPDITTINSNSFYIEGTTSGIISGTFDVDDRTLIFTPDSLFQSNENINIELTTDIKSSNGLSLFESYNYQFTTEEVTTAPEITTQPANAELCAGSESVFEIVVTDNGNVTYQWQENSGSDFVDLINNENYNGVFTEKLYIPNTSHILNGYEYRCLVTNEIGTTTSNAVLLTVNGQLAKTGDDLAFYFETLPIPTLDNLALIAEATISGVTGTWTTTSTGTIVNPNTYSTTVTGLESGVANFEWTLNGEGCTSTDSLKITIGSLLGAANAVVSWDNPADWTPPVVPGPNDKIVLLSSIVNINGIEVTCKQIYVGAGATLNVSGSAKGNAVLRTNNIEIEQDIEKYPNAPRATDNKGAASIIIRSGGSIEIEQDIEKSKSNRGLVIGSGGSIEIEQDIEKLGSEAKLIIHSGLDLIIEGTDATKSPALARIGNGGSIEIEQDIEKGVAGNVYIGSNGSIEIEQDIEKTIKGVANLTVRGGGSIEIEQDIEKRGIKGAANLIIRNAGSIEIEQDIEKGAIGNLKIGNGGTVTVEGNYTAKNRAFANVRVGSGGSIEIEQDIEKGTKGVANLIVRGGSIEIEQDIEKGASGQLFVGTGGSIEIEQDIEKGTFGQIYAPKIAINNGFITIGNIVKGGDKGAASLNTGHIEIEQDIEKNKILSAGLYIMSNGELAYDPNFGLLYDEFIYLNPSAAITVENGGLITFDYPNHKKFTINTTASLIGDFNAFTGRCKYINNFKADESKIFSVPIEEELNNVYKGETVIYWTENNLMWNEVEPTNNISPTLGYVGIFENDMTVEYNGNLLSGDQNVAVTANNSLPFREKGWNFVGNPYASYVDFNAIIFDNNIAPVKYNINPETQSFSIYCQNGLSLNDGTHYVKDAEAFFVKAINDASFDFTDDQRLHYFNQTKQETKTDGDLLTLKVSDSNSSDYMKIVFDEAATENYDIQSDAPAITALSSNFLSLCVVTPNQEELAINSMPSPMLETKVYNLYFNALEPGSHTISVDDITISADISVHLKDNVTNSFIELHETSEYTFDANQEDATDRFTLHFNDVMTSSNTIEQNSLKIYSNKNTIYINISDIQGSSTINIVDMKGINISKKIVNGSGLHQIEMNKPTGYYIVNVTTNKGTVSQKVFIMQ